MRRGLSAVLATAGCLASSGPSHHALAAGAPPTTVVGASLQARALPEQEAALELFRARLMQSVRRQGGYPAQALEQKLEGNVGFEVGVGADGALRRVDLARSSGHAMLDRDAADLLGRAVTRTEIPQALQNRPFVIHVQLAFRLPD